MNSCTRGFTWCTGGSPDCRGDHQRITYVLPTLGDGTPFNLDDDQKPLSIGAGVHFNEREGDGAPRVIIHIQGGPRDLDTQATAASLSASASAETNDPAKLSNSPKRSLKRIAATDTVLPGGENSKSSSAVRLATASPSSRPSREANSSIAHAELNSTPISSSLGLMK